MKPVKEKKQKENQEEQYEALNDKYLRLVAEFDNYRKRNARERLDLVKTAGEDLIQGILPVLDDFKMAMDAMVVATDMAAVCEGVDLIYRKLYKYLESKGMQPIEAVGLPLDTDLHEAVSQFPTEEAEQKGKIIDVLQQGYTLNGKVIRYAKVVVGV
ncbi:MAG: nucleotide exchange factor GrpE [Bacteroidales bacterium]|nr:nucleotide exchange factor GrpE [Bacteroidales bacterium]